MPECHPKGLQRLSYAAYKTHFVLVKLLVKPWGTCANSLTSCQRNKLGAQIGQETPSPSRGITIPCTSKSQRWLRCILTDLEGSLWDALSVRQHRLAVRSTDPPRRPHQLPLHLEGGGRKGKACMASSGPS